MKQPPKSVYSNTHLNVSTVRKENMVDVLNLAGADLDGPDFDPVPTGWYICTIKKFEDKFTKGGADAALPAGTPMLNVHFRIRDGWTVMEDDKERNVGGKYVFKQLIIPPAKVNGKAYEHYKKMMGQIARFFICAGVPESEVLSGEFNIEDRERFIGLEVGVRVKKYFNTYKQEWDNDVQSFKPASEVEGAEAGATAGIV